MGRVRGLFMLEHRNQSSFNRFVNRQNFDLEALNKCRSPSKGTANDLPTLSVSLTVASPRAGSGLTNISMNTRF